MVHITRNNLGELMLECGGEEPQAVKPVRALPITEPDAWIGLMDEDGKTVHMVRALTELDPDSREVLTHELDRLYFLPKVRQIHQVTEEYGVLRVVVDTDRGARTFEVRTREHIRFLPNGRILLRDLDGNRYEIPAIGDLDLGSQTLAETH